MQSNVDVLAFLKRVMQRNTQHYQSDFQYDVARLMAAVQAHSKEERTFYWMSRPCGTWCLNEREVFIRETEAHTIWIYYEGEADKIKAYRVTVTGQQDGVPVGDIFPISYKEQVQRVKANAVHAAAVTLLFESGQTITLPYEEVTGNYPRIINQYGTIRQICYRPEIEAELSAVITAEHRVQNGRTHRTPKKAIPSNIR